ncbi:MAG: hypothetical protein NTW55_06960 [Planctomycetota bacterium]|nr:hypothetical protein [Planctomycetota bacterium]
MKKLIALSVVASILSLFHGGCAVIARMGTPTSHEIKIPAQYDIIKNKGDKILILVEQPGWLNVQVDMRSYLTDSISREITQKTKISAGRFIPYNKLSEYRSNTPNFASLLPVEIGKAMDANIVLVVRIDDFQMAQLVDSGYYKAALDAKAILFDSVTGVQLWPAGGNGKIIKVGFEIEQGGRDIATSRLAAAAAYCTVRYFYNCPKDQFKIADDRSGAGFNEWKE